MQHDIFQADDLLRLCVMLENNGHPLHQISRIITMLFLERKYLEENMKGNQNGNQEKFSKFTRYAPQMAMSYDCTSVSTG